MKRTVSNKRFAWLSSIAAILVLLNLCSYFWPVGDVEGGADDLLDVPKMEEHPTNIQVANSGVAAPVDVSPEVEVRLSDDSVGNPFGALSLGQETVASAPEVNLNTGPRTVVTPVVLAPPPVPAAKTLDPVAPPLPFQFIGLIAGQDVGGGKTIAFLNQSGRALTIGEGDEINAIYKVEAILDNRIDLIYLPLKTRQSLHIARQ